jgi:hypothetical protein
VLEAEITSPEEKFAKLYLNGLKLGMAGHFCHSSYGHGKNKIGGSWSRSAWAKGKNLSQNILRAERAGSMA